MTESDVVPPPGAVRSHDPEFEALLDYLKRARGFDFKGYKRPTLVRRTNRRMQTVGAASYAAYIDYLEVHPDEFTALFDALLINVTCFFRDAEAWRHLAAEVLPALLARKAPDEPVRVWIAGCASGEEAYTLAIVLAEALGDEAFKRRVKIYATDVDDDALAQARTATYTERQLDDVPPELRDRYFERGNGDAYTFRADLRRAVIFGRHNLAVDAPISRVDLLVCRNALMYFNAETQLRIVVRFHFALGDHAVLFLGRAETLLTRTGLFTPVNLKRRLFSRVARPGVRTPMLELAGVVDDHADEAGPAAVSDAAFDAAPVAQIVVDGDGALAAANDRARTLFRLAPGDVGRPLQDLELSYRPLELRSRIDELYVTRRPVTVEGVTLPAANGNTRTYDVQFIALDGASRPGDGGGVSIAFCETTAATRLQQQLEHANQELAAAYEELQSANEELETANEELQSTVEELETTNEELQSTNEELETMNEELQSTNEELHTINDELRRRSDELQQVNLFLESILGSLRGGVVVLDRELRVIVWNDQSTELWGLRADEVLGHPFLELDIGLPVAELRPQIQASVGLAEVAERVIIPATNRRGKPIECAVTCLPLRSANQGAARGVILVME